MKDIIARTAVEFVGPGSAVKLVVTGPALEDVVSSTTAQYVVA